MTIDSVRPVIVVPYRNTSPARAANFAAVAHQLDHLGKNPSTYATAYPWVHGDAGGEPFSIAATWNHLAAQITEQHPEWTHIIRWAADFLLDKPLRQLAHALHHHDWDRHPHLLPFRTVQRLTGPQTARYHADGTLPAIQPGKRPYGGVNITSRAAWDQLGGFNEAFRGWGHEDREYIHRLEATFGPRQWAPTGHMWILHHPRNTNDPYWQKADHNHQLLQQLRKENP